MRVSPLLLGLTLCACATPTTTDAEPEAELVSWSPGRYVRLQAKDADTGAPLGHATFSEFLTQRLNQDFGQAYQPLPSEAGNFEYHLPEGSDAWILVEAPGYLPVGVHVTGGLEQPVPLRMRPMGKAAIQVLVNGLGAGRSVLSWNLHPELTEPAKAIPNGAWKWIEPWGHHGLPFMTGEVETDEHGYAELPVGPVDGYSFDRLELRVEGPDGLSKHFRVLVPERLGEQPLELELLPGTAQLKFEILDEEGWPMPGIPVQCEYEVQSDYGFRLQEWEGGDVEDLRTLTSDMQGRIDARIPAPVVVRWSVKVPGWPAQEGELVVSAAKSHTVRIELASESFSEALVLGR